MSVNQSNTCVICYNLLSEDAAEIPVELPKNRSKVKVIQPSTICSLSCGHLFHKICAVKAIEYGHHNQTCPICQKRAMKRQMLDVILPGTPDHVGTALDNHVCDQYEVLKRDNLKLKGEFLEQKTALRNVTRKATRLNTLHIPRWRQQEDRLQQKKAELIDRLNQLRQTTAPPQIPQ